MEIKLIKRKSKTTNRVSLSLEYYMGYTKTEEGKIKHNRKYETLEYYLIDPARTKADKEHNKTNLEIANNTN